MTNSNIDQTLSVQTVSAIYRKLNRIANDLNDVRWQLLQPVGESAREDLCNELQDVIIQARIALDNLN